MKRLHKFLKLFIFVQLGSCCGRVLQMYLDFVNHPEMYAYYAAPWYTHTRITITVILTAITVSITTIAYFVVGHIIKKREQNKTD